MCHFVVVILVEFDRSDHQISLFLLYMFWWICNGHFIGLLMVIDLWFMFEFGLFLAFGYLLLLDLMGVLRFLFLLLNDTDFPLLLQH